MAATLSPRRADSGRDAVADFLQNVIGKEESLNPSCGRLREIHARIGKEVQDAKNELHSTVQSEWPALQRQLGTTRSISDRLKTIQKTVEALESQVDGDDTSLRPKLQAGLASHAALEARHVQSQTLVDLLAALQTIQSAVANVQNLLDSGRLEEAVPAILQANAYISQQIEPWMLKSTLVVSKRDECKHLCAVVQERLQNALDSCINVESAGLVLRDETNMEGRNGQQALPIQVLLASLGQIEPLDGYFDHIVKSILSKLVQPVLISDSGSLSIASEDEHSTALHIQASTDREPEGKLAGLRTLTRALSARIFGPDTPSEVRTLFFSIFVPPVQKLLRKHVLEACIPLDADPSTLRRFQAICQAVSVFEREDLASHPGHEPLLSDWAANAGSHWARSMIETSFSQLRMAIVSPDYWNKTETVDWLDNPASIPRQPAFINGNDARQELGSQTPAVAESQRNSVRVASVQKSTADAPEEDAWGLDDAVEERLELVSAEPLAHRQVGAVEESPDPNAEDAWGFDADEEDEPLASTSAVSAPVQPAAGATTEPDADEDAGGWSFDDDAEEIASVGSRKTHSRKGSLEEGWDAWSKPDEEQALRPIGKPTKVISGKLGENKGPVSPQAEPEVLTASATATKSDQSTSTAMQPPSLPVEPAVPIKEKMLVSTKSRRVLELATQSLAAAAAVLETNDSPFASTSRQLVEASRDTFDLYRAICSTVHKDLIFGVPSIGMQYANDCRWLARHASEACLSAVGKGKGRQIDLGDMYAALERLGRYGENVIEEQLELQRQPLIDCLDEADGLRYTDDPQAFQKCQRSIRQIISTLERLSHAWKPVMLKRSYYESLGILVNGVLLRVLVDIENQEDISEEASHRLNELCQMLHDAEKLFMDGEESTVALHVPVWFKFKFLSELLEASMADIMFLFNEGHLVDFSSTELTKLVIALFSDSQLRQKNLETIARGR